MVTAVACRLDRSHLPGTCAQFCYYRRPAKQTILEFSVRKASFVYVLAASVRRSLGNLEAPTLSYGFRSSVAVIIMILSYFMILRFTGFVSNEEVLM